MSKFMSRLLKVVQNSILGFKSVEQTSKDDKGMTNSNPHEPLPTSSDRWLETAKIAWIPTKLKNRMKGYHFNLPGSLAQISSLIREKTKKTMTATRNRYLPPCDETDSDLYDEIGKIVKRKSWQKKKKSNSPEKVFNTSYRSKRENYETEYPNSREFRFYFKTYEMFHTYIVIINFKNLY